jgi:cyclic pyranopterin phosphate synthase
MPARAGLNRVNVSLDTLDAARFAHITRGGRLADTLAGIAAAEAAGLAPLKINVVAMRGFNDDEVAALAALTIEHDWHVRFIELMPLNDNSLAFEAGYVSADEIRATLAAAFGEVQPVVTADRPAWSGPAEYVRLPGGRGTVGVITPVSRHFCAACNRLRLTADGKLRMCLFSEEEIDLRVPLRAGAGERELQELLRRAIAAKPVGHHLREQQIPHDRVMSQIGG